MALYLIQIGYRVKYRVREDHQRIKTKQEDKDLKKMDDGFPIDWS